MKNNRIRVIVSVFILVFIVAMSFLFVGSVYAAGSDPVTFYLSCTSPQVGTSNPPASSSCPYNLLPSTVDTGLFTYPGADAIIGSSSTITVSFLGSGTVSAGVTFVDYTTGVILGSGTVSGPISGSSCSGATTISIAGSASNGAKLSTGDKVYMVVDVTSGYSSATVCAGGSSPTEVSLVASISSSSSSSSTTTTTTKGIGVPEFPLGPLALLAMLAVTVPGLILLRRKNFRVSG